MPVRGIRGTTHWLPVTWEVTGTSQCSTFNNHSGGTTLIGGHGSLIRPFATSRWQPIYADGTKLNLDLRCVETRT